MPSSGFFENLNRISNSKREDIIEKDFHLHRFLKKISDDEVLNGNLLFKGGTCLVKAYTGYFRFSEDLDFTWKHQSTWKDKSPSSIKKKCSEKISDLLTRFSGISDELGFIFDNS